MNADTIEKLNRLSPVSQEMFAVMIERLSLLEANIGQLQCSVEQLANPVFDPRNTDMERDDTR